MHHNTPAECLHHRIHGGGRALQALECYTAIVRQHPGLAITEYARVGRALMLFQTGQRQQAILQLDDLVVTFVGCAVLRAWMLHPTTFGVTFTESVD